MLLAYLWLRQGKSIFLLFAAAISLAAFAWLLTQHPTSAGEFMQLMVEFMFPQRFFGCGLLMVSNQQPGIL